jgi:hypothetical protein
MQNISELFSGIEVKSESVILLEHDLEESEVKMTSRKRKSTRTKVSFI